MSEKGGINYLFVIIIMIFTVGLATGSMYFMLTRVGVINGSAEQQQAEGETSSARELGPVTELEEFTINLRDDRRILRVRIALEVNDSDVVEEINTRKPQIRDLINTIAREKTYNELQSSEGITDLRSKIRDETNTKLSDGEVTNVFFTEFMVH